MGLISGVYCTRWARWRHGLSVRFSIGEHGLDSLVNSKTEESTYSFPAWRSAKKKSRQEKTAEVACDHDVIF